MRAHTQTRSHTLFSNLTSASLLVACLQFSAGVCNQLFSIFNCRVLDKDLQVLRMDYRVDCQSPTHQQARIVAGLMIVVFAFGIPISMGILMVRRMREYSSSAGSDRFMARRVADELKITDVEAADAIRDVSTGREYSFLVNAYKPRYYFWEGVDMVRKLVLVGFLVLVGRGSVFQLFVAVLVSCMSLVLQVHLAPCEWLFSHTRGVWRSTTEICCVCRVCR